MAERILLIDNTYDYWRRRSAETLSSQYEVTTVTSAQDIPITAIDPNTAIIYSVDRFRAEDYEVVQGLSGKRKRSDKPLRTVLVICNRLTAELFSDIYSCGAADAIERPYDMQILAEWVHDNVAVPA